MRNQNLPSGQRGLALVETVIVLPVLIFIMVATAEVTNIFIQHNTLTKLVRDGARFVNDSVFNHAAGVMGLDAQLIADTKSIVVYGDTSNTGTPLVYGLTTADVSVTEVAPQIVEVSATYPYTGILGTVLTGVGGGAGTSLSFNLSATVSMRAL